jgi:nucleotide-binding universal stress UspA family protein
MSGIIVGVGGSGHSSRALEWAVSRAAALQVPLTVLTVRQAVAGLSGPAPYPEDQFLATQAREAVKEQAHKATEALGDAPRPPRVTVNAVTGHPAEELLRAAGNADMIVVGARGAGGFARLRMGSVSSQVTQHARCAVVVVPADRA